MSQVQRTVIGVNNDKKPGVMRIGPVTNNSSGMRGECLSKQYGCANPGSPRIISQACSHSRRGFYLSAIKSALLFVFTLLLGTTAWAQEFPRHEVAADYSYAYYVPSIGYAKATNQSLNGGGGAYVFNFTPYLGIKADFQGYGSFTNRFSIPQGGFANVQGNLFTYLFGPQIKFRTHLVQPYGNLLVGGAYSNLYRNAYQQCGVTVVCSVSRAPSGNAFAFAIGGGVDIPVGNHVQIRPASFDYLLTDFSNPFNHGSQSNWRYTAGVNFTFGDTGKSR